MTKAILRKHQCASGLNNQLKYIGNFILNNTVALLTAMKTFIEIFKSAGRLIV